MFFTGHHIINGGQKRLFVCVFQHIAVGTCIDQFGDHTSFIVHRENDNPHIGKAPAYEPGSFKALHYRHVDIEEHEVNFQHFEGGEGFLSVARFSGDFKPAFVCQHCTQSVEHNLVVVCEQQPDGHVRVGGLVIAAEYRFWSKLRSHAGCGVGLSPNFVWARIRSMADRLRADSYLAAL